MGSKSNGVLEMNNTLVAINFQKKHLYICLVLENLLFFKTNGVRVIRKVIAKTLDFIFKEEREHQTFLCTKTRQKTIWIGV